MPRTGTKPKTATKPKLKTFHATMVVSAWRNGASRPRPQRRRGRCSPPGRGYRCQIGDRLHLEVEALDDAA
jgi:hypothetical protein